MNKTSRVVGGVALLAFGIGWVLVLTGLVNIKLDGWWTFLIIIPCLVALFSSKHKNGPLIGLGVGVLLLLATLGIVNWDDFWKYIICLVAVVWGIFLIFARKSGIYTKHADPHTVNELKKFDQDGRQVHQISVSFGKQLYEFAGQQFEGAKVESHFGFVALDLRGADIFDGVSEYSSLNLGISAFKNFLQMSEVGSISFSMQISLKMASFPLFFRANPWM